MIKYIFNISHSVIITYIFLFFLGCGYKDDPVYKVQKEASIDRVDSKNGVDYAF